MTSNIPLALPHVIGHRGAAGHAPENTLAGIREAARLGATWVEFDVMLSVDDHPMLIHDLRVDRTTDGRGDVASLRRDDLRALDAGTWFGERFAGERIPTLEEAIALLARLSLGANVEIKPSKGRERETGHAVARTLAQAWPAGLPPPLISSFKIEALAAAREAAPAIPRGLLVGAVPADWRRVIAELGCTTLHADERRLTPATVREARQENVPVLAYTVNRPERARTLFAMGVEAVITDVPDRMPKR